MPTAKLIYYPDSSGTLERIDLGENLSDLQVTPQRTVEDAYTLSGSRYRTGRGGVLRVRIIDDRFTDSDLAYALESLWTHLELGGFCGVVENSGKAWAGYVESPPSRGDTTLLTGGNIYAPFTSGLAVDGAIADDDIVCIQSNPPGIIREYCKVDSVSGDTITLSDAVRYNYPSGSTVLVRHRDFFPAMRAPAETMNTQIVTHDRRISFTLDLDLEEAPDLIEALDSSGGGIIASQLLNTTSFAIPDSIGSLESILDDWRRDVRELGESFATGTTSGG